jgi:diguanylate cyclase (GGDEF)-like protein
VRILLLEDMAVTAEVVKGYVAAAAPRAQVEWAATLSAALDQLARGSFDLVLADLNLPDSTGIATLERVLEATDRLVVVLTSEDERLMQEAALERGAYDFLHKSRLSKASLGQLVRLATLQAETFRILRQNIAELELRQRQLDNLSLYDPVTGVPNRSLFVKRLEEAIGTAAERGAKTAVVLLDLARFRGVNESRGRRAGDELLSQVAARLAQSAGRNDVGRVGGDQFVALLAGVKGRSEAARRARSLLGQCFGRAFVVGGEEIHSGAKAGIVVAPNDGADGETLLERAEAALRKAKQGSELTVLYSASLSTTTAERNRLRLALRNREFVHYYQPKIDLTSERIVGLEALIRWESRELGVVPPDRFLPLMEETGLILDVSAWSFRQALEDGRRWAQAGLRVPPIAVNLSALQLRDPSLPGLLEQALGGATESVRLELEVTENALMQDLEDSVRRLHALRALGTSIAIDDFGTGYSSLAYLAKAPVQSLKVDRSFVADMLERPATMTLVRTIISLGQSLGLKVVAEGVDGMDQAKMLRLLRCDQMQGNCFCAPVPAPELEQVLRRHA